MRMSEVQEMTGLKREHLELFTFAIPIIEVVEPESDPLLSFREVYCFVKIFKWKVKNEIFKRADQN